MGENVYYEKLKTIIAAAIAAFEDKEITTAEIWAFVLILGDGVKTLMTEADDLSEEDLAEMKEAATLLYVEYVEPLDVPGPDYIIDPLIRNVILPGVIEGAFRLAQKKAEEE